MNSGMCAALDCRSAVAPRVSFLAVDEFLSGASEQGRQDGSFQDKELVLQSNSGC